MIKQILNFKNSKYIKPIQSKLNNILLSNTNFKQCLIINSQKFNFGSKKLKKDKVDLITFKHRDSIEDQSLKGDIQKNEFQEKSETDKKVETKVDEIPSILEEIEQSKKELEEKKKREMNTPERLTTKILCDLIGTKHYPVNEEIEMDKETIVSVYDENDKYLTAMNLSAAIEKAKSLGKEIILRNDKIKPPIVKMMKYRLELIKRLMKKLGKNMGMELDQSEVSNITKIMVFSSKMAINDLNSKIDKLRQLLAENNYVKVIIPCDLSDSDQTARAISILKNIEQEIQELSKVKVGPIKQKKKNKNLSPR